MWRANKRSALKHRDLIARRGKQDTLKNGKASAFSQDAGLAPTFNQSMGIPIPCIKRDGLPLGTLR